MKYRLTSDLHYYCQRIYPDNPIHAGEYSLCAECKRLAFLVQTAGELTPDQDGLISTPKFTIHQRWVVPRDELDKVS